MPNNVSGKSSNSSEKKIVISLFVQNPHLRTNYIEANVEEDIDLKNQFRIKNFKETISIRDACSKIYVCKLFKNDMAFIDVKI